MMLRNESWRLALAATTLALAPAFGTAARPQGNPAVAPQVAATNPVASVDPPVPHPGVRPCVVQLLQDRPWPQQGVEMEIDPTITYTPPLACPPPWSKVILQLDMQSNLRSIVDTLGMDLARVRLFRSATPRYDGLSSWHIERDLTDYSALFKAPHTGQIWSTQDPLAPDYGWDDRTIPIYRASARLLFYPSRATTPAPRVPDAVIPVNEDTPATLPHNIVRAYLDVENDLLVDDPLWYTCYADDVANLPLADIFAPGTVPKESINPPPQGCGGGSFREFRIRVDGTLAGVAPVFPLVIADLTWYHRNTADLPIPTLEMLNFKPYRVDLTPFAARLSAAGPHSVTINSRPPREGYSRGGGGTLLLYLDRNRTQITGAVTLNTLATANGAPAETHTLAQSGDVTQGDIRTRQHRDFTIRGFVNTSRGRIDSSVHQTNDFSNLQHFYLKGPDWPGSPDQMNRWLDKVYIQDIWLANSAVQTSRRSQGTRLLSQDQVRTRYPLQLNYHMITKVMLDDGGFYVDINRTNLIALQSRVVDGDHYKAGFGHYTTHAGARFYSIRRGGLEQPNPLWEGYTTRNYRDNFGSCYHGELGARDGAIINQSLGAPCPGGRNHVRWFAHPDGSPDTLGWWW